VELIEGLLGDVPTLVPVGNVDHGSSGVLRAALDTLTKARHNIVFLDLTDVDDMDSDGLSVLAAWVHALGGKGWLGVVAPKPNIRRLLETSCLLPHPNVRVFETRQLARVATQERQST
jgi:anti-anti-sigma factor